MSNQEVSFFREKTKNLEVLMNIILILISSIIVILAVIITVFAINVYNNLVTQRNRYKNAFSQIDVQLKRRYDLIPNLVETAKEYLKHEKETLIEVMKMRNNAKSANEVLGGAPDNPQAMEQFSAAESLLTGGLGRLMAVIENYPDLKANQQMTQLNEELTSTENKIAFARQAYNDCVMFFNTFLEKFPNNLLSNAFGFKTAILFEVANKSERNNVKVKF